MVRRCPVLRFIVPLLDGVRRRLALSATVSSGGRRAVPLIVLVLILAAVFAVPVSGQAPFVPPGSREPILRVDANGPVGVVAAVAFSPNGRTLYAGGRDQIVRTWNLARDGKTFTPAKRTWTDIGYAALATGDINHDGFPDIVGVSHFGGIQTLLSDGQGGFTDTILQRQDGYVAAQLADVNGDGELDLILLGFAKAGIEIYFGDGKGHWTFHTRLPVPPPGRTMPGRALVLDAANFLRAAAPQMPGVREGVRQGVRELRPAETPGQTVPAESEAAYRRARPAGPGSHNKRAP